MRLVVVDQLSSNRSLFALGLLAFLACTACDDSPPPHGPHQGRDIGTPDLGFLADGRVPNINDDAATFPDAQVEDLGFVDAAPDAGPTDLGVDAGPDLGQPWLDQDQDTIADRHEGKPGRDTDRDGVPDYLDPDSDADGILDSLEAGDRILTSPPHDSDRDGIPNFQDLDSDDDGLSDRLEGTADPDADTVPNYLDLDSDGDSILDSLEGLGDTDNDGLRDSLDLDSDADRIPDIIETALDSDGDEKPNFRDLDSDADGISDLEEGYADPDRDGRGNYLDLDSDGDDILDSIEGTSDPDGDTIANYLDTDSDGDDIADAHETEFDFDLDGIPNYLDLDSDDDGLPDRSESGDFIVASAPVDHDRDGAPDFVDIDSDGDTITDRQEGIVDSDHDGLLDYIDTDSDGDLVPDAVEAGDSNELTLPVDSDGDGTPDYLDTDSDADTILDSQEGTVDTDLDGLPDRISLDSDADGIPDKTEAGDTNPVTLAIDTDGDGRPDFQDVDSDGDTLLDSQETGCPGSTERLNPDSDGDSFQDAAETIFGSDPCNNASVIDDFYFVLSESASAQQSPLVFSDTQIDEADFALNIDTTGSMGGEITNLRNSLSNTIIPGVRAKVTNPAFSVSSYEDFPVAPHGNELSGDRPFRLATRMTTSAATAQLAVNTLATHNGEDIPESGIEALYQIATGAGVSWGTQANQSVPAFDVSQNQVAGVADGTIGGVGFREGALPVVVHITDAPSHFAEDYRTSIPGLRSATATSAQLALSALGARVITVTNEAMATPPSPATMQTIYDDVCAARSNYVYGEIRSPVGIDTDWFELTGAAAGQLVIVESFAERLGSTLNSMLAVYDADGNLLSFSDDINAGVIHDSLISVTLSGNAPYYLAVSAFNDSDFNGSGAVSTGFYFLDISIAGVKQTTSLTACHATDHGDSSVNSTRLTALANATAATDQAACVATCEQQLDAAPLRLPYGISELSGATIPPCAWDHFGGARPANCSANLCCTGRDGLGVPANADNLCPLSFEIDADGTGIDQAVVGGIEALINFSSFTVTTQIRRDDAEFDSSGVDTSCFVHSVTPASTTQPNSCAPVPQPADLLPPAGSQDSYQGVVPGTSLTFQVESRNYNLSTGSPCANEGSEPKLYRAYIDILADGVTVLDTRNVYVIVPAKAASGGN